jgi:hypothetical protein
MTSRKNKNSSLPRKAIKLSSRVADNEYDLERNIRRINSYSKNERSRDTFRDHITDSGEYDERPSYGKSFVEPIHDKSNPLRTGDNTAWNSYVRLDDKISDFNYKNDQAHTDLRRELEAKIKDASVSFGESIKECKEEISKRLHIQWYLWTIGGLVAIVGIWYIFSYIDVHPLPEKVQNIEKCLNNIEKKIEVSQHDSIVGKVKE